MLATARLLTASALALAALWVSPPLPWLSRTTPPSP